MKQQNIYVLTLEDIDRIESLLSSAQLAINELFESRQITLESIPYLNGEKLSQSKSDKMIWESLGLKNPESDLF